jgi:Ca-activated chloride channel family protein
MPPFLVPVEVRDPMNRFVTGLDRENFKLIEDGVYQEISQFWREDAPLSVGIVFDVSDGLGSKLERKQQAVAQLMKNGNPEDEFFLVQFSDRGEMRSGNFLAAGIAPNIQEIHNRLTFLQLKGRTTLLDGVSMAMNQVRHARNPRKAIVIICDAGDDSVRYTESQVKNAVRAIYVPIYAIGIFGTLASRGPAPEEMSLPAVLSEITNETGGRHLDVDSLAELPGAASKIGVELRNSYILGYGPKNTARDGTYRKVEVKLVQPRGLPPLKAIYRTGYFAPTQ